MSQNRRRRRDSEKVEVKPETPARQPGPRNAAQTEAMRLFRDKDILFLLGAPGTGKTHVAMALAWAALKAETVSRVILTRPVVECDNEQLGHLPGELKDKYAVWLAPYLDVLHFIVGKDQAGKVLNLFETCPLAFIRGRTLFNCVAILDEAQNATVSQLKAYLTRVGENGKLIICGDPRQSDMPGGGQHLIDVANAVAAEGVASVVQFSDEMIVRSPHIVRILKAFDGLEKKRK